ncbi:MAG: TrmH family RNA methyltransferase [Micrococcales bacterium]|nr:TrmH family RNA methyltransferase [Micrococcales bacterium]
MSRIRRIERRNADFQQWESLLRNRTKRHRAGAFIVQGVRPITLAVAAGWPMRALIRPVGTRPSAWAAGVWQRCASQGAELVELAPDLLAELSDRESDGDHTELVAVLAMPQDDLRRLQGPSSLIVVFDRPSQPGNIGTLQRSIDAFAGTGLVVTGHAADPYDPKAIRASTGSCFSVPTVRCSSSEEVLAWVERQRARGVPLGLWGTDEGGESDLEAVPLDAPIVLVVGNETRGMAAAWRQACDGVISLPMAGTASSLNAAVAGSIVLHAAMRRRTSRT